MENCSLREVQMETRKPLRNLQGNRKMTPWIEEGRGLLAKFNQTGAQKEAEVWSMVPLAWVIMNAGVLHLGLGGALHHGQFSRPHHA